MLLRPSPRSGSRPLPNAPDPRDLTRSQFRLCKANRQIFIRTLISVFCEAARLFVVGFKCELPAGSVTQTGAIQDLLLHKDIIREIGYLRWEGGDWVHLTQSGRRIGIF